MACVAQSSSASAQAIYGRQPEPRTLERNDRGLADRCAQLASALVNERVPDRLAGALGPLQVCEQSGPETLAALWRQVGADTRCSATSRG